MLASFYIHHSIKGITNVCRFKDFEKENYFAKHLVESIQSFKTLGQSDSGLVQGNRA